MKTKWEMWIILRPRCGKYLSFIVNMLKPITISISVWHNGGSVRNKTFKKKGNVNIDKIKYPPPGDISLPYRKIRNHFKKMSTKKKKPEKILMAFKMSLVVCCMRISVAETYFCHVTKYESSYSFQANINWFRSLFFNVW